MDPFADHQAGITQIAESDAAMQLLNEHLQEIVEGSAFSGSDRCRQFLLYVVRQAMAGNLNSLKERVIGVEVFGRSPNYNSSEDAIVRVTASDVRKRLHQHYLKNGSSAFRVNLPIGSYVPEITAISGLLVQRSTVAKSLQPPSPPFQGVNDAPKPPAAAQESAYTSTAAVSNLTHSETGFSEYHSQPRSRFLLFVLEGLVALLILLNLVQWSNSRKGASGSRATALSVLPWSAFF